MFVCGEHRRTPGHTAAAHFRPRHPNRIEDVRTVTVDLPQKVPAPALLIAASAAGEEAARRRLRVGSSGGRAWPLAGSGRSRLSSWSPRRRTRAGTTRAPASPANAPPTGRRTRSGGSGHGKPKRELRRGRAGRMVTRGGGGGSRVAGDDDDGGGGEGQLDCAHSNPSHPLYPSRPPSPHP